jgi:hypothetical protein
LSSTYPCEVDVTSAGLALDAVEMVLPDAKVELK